MDISLVYEDKHNFIYLTMHTILSGWDRPSLERSQFLLEKSVYNSRGADAGDGRPTHPPRSTVAALISVTLGRHFAYSRELCKWTILVSPRSVLRA
jgi:hypothetical protein